MSRQRIAVTKTRHAAAERYTTFARAYIENGNNATQAAITAGYAPKTAYSKGSQLLKMVEVKALLAKATKKAADKLDVSIERVLLEAARMGLSDVRRLYHPDGRLKRPHELDDDTAAAVAAMETVTTTTTAKGKKARTRVTTDKVKLWDKGAGIERLMRHFGMFEKDNQQRKAELNLQVAVLGPA